MRKNLVKVSFLALALSVLASCGEANKTVKESDNAMVDKVIVARTPINSKGISTGEIQTVIVNKRSIRSQKDIIKAFDGESVLNPSVIRRTSSTSTNNCMARRCMVADGWTNNYYVGAAPCTVVGGCMWFPGKNILKFTGRVLHTLGEGISGLGRGLVHGANGGLLDCPTCRVHHNIPVRPWIGANFSYRANGCAAVSCTTFYAPGEAFIDNNYSYTKYSKVEYESIQSSSMSNQQYGVFPVPYFD